MAKSRKQQKSPEKKEPVRHAEFNWIRTDLGDPELIQVLIYARYSTDEQNKSSIADQQAYCKRLLHSFGARAATVTFLSDEGISGELLSRPGIDAVQQGIKDRSWNLILCEDASRLFRNENATMQLAGLAVDYGVRIIAINDYVDTTDEDWETRIHLAMQVHGQTNRYTSHRIKRRHQALWDMGAAVTAIRTGYQRRPTLVATSTEPAKGPFYDEIDPQWQSVVVEAYTRIAGLEAPWDVAMWLTQAGLPKRSNSRLKDWTDKNVIALIQNPIYRGLERYRVTYSKKIHTTGDRDQVRNGKQKVLERKMPHLRLLGDALWFAANDAISSRSPGHLAPLGPDHPGYQIPRGTRGPLSGIFRCHCGANMVPIGKNGFRCSKATDRIRPCWVKATTKREVVHGAVKEHLISAIKTVHDEIPSILAAMRSTVTDQGVLQDELAHYRQQEGELLILIENLTDAIESGRDDLKTVISRLQRRETELARVQAKIQLAERRWKSAKHPVAAEIDANIQELISAVSTMDRASRPALLQLIADLHAVPFSQFGSGKVVLRARLAWNPAAILPPAFRLQIQSLIDVGALPNLSPRQMEFDLFELSGCPQHWKEVHELTSTGLRPTEIGKRLGLTKRMACLARDFGQQLVAAGLTQPFTELSKPPANGARWGRRKKRAAGT